MGRLDEIEARLSAATPGPWEWEPADDSLVSLGTKGAALFEGHVLSCTRCDSCRQHGDAKRTPCHWPKEGDAALIEHAPADIRALLGIARAVQTLLEDERRYLPSRLARSHTILKRLHQLRAEMAALDEGEG